MLAFVGSPGMCGAAVMSSTAVLRSGAGMVTAAVPKSMLDAVASQVREVMTLPLPMEGDALSKTAAGILEERLRTQNVLLAGCGIGTGENTKKVLLPLITACEKPLVLDADGINLLKGNINILKNKNINNKNNGGLSWHSEISLLSEMRYSEKNADLWVRSQSVYRHLWMI